MNHAAAILFAVAAPAAAWHVLAGGDRLTAAPFGWPRLLVAHLAAAVPLAVCLAARIGPRGGPWARAAVAAGVTLGTAAALPFVADFLTAAEVGFTGRAIVRTLLAALAATAWVAVVPVPAARLPWVAAVAFAVVPPLAYAHRLAETRAADFDTFAKTGRLVRALAALDGLADLGSDKRFAGKSVRELIPLLKKDVDKLAARAAGPLPPTEEGKVGRAMLLVALNRPAEAEDVLKEIASPPPAALMVRAAVARERGRWADLEAACRSVTDRTDVPPEVLQDAFDGLGEAHRNLGRAADAAAAYRAAADRLPHRAGYYELQLGLLAADRGRPHDALAHFAEALRLDPTLEPTVAPHRRRVSTNSPSCLGGW
jgi:tetratricopeptide (TPR) repeat protein